MKTRDNIYLVVRGEGEAICGGFSSFEDADDYRGACEQEFLDKTGHHAHFFVRVTIFYG